MGSAAAWHCFLLFACTSPSYSPFTPRSFSNRLWLYFPFVLQVLHLSSVVWSGDGESITSMAPHRIMRGSACIRKGVQERSPSFCLQCSSCPYDVLWDRLSEVPPYHTNKRREVKKPCEGYLASHRQETKARRGLVTCRKSFHSLWWSFNQKAQCSWTHLTLSPEF